ncbi:unnamed protein product [Hymenolepis diminuta]|uniref:ELKS/RAB6-interacting/CAST family member 2 n=2 Tax=Hymenolepis diminuta TaxID=6216 RepID=A0A0R3SVV7_HYMDI|nr:unnamed protein product [Hymenolepis diminuta]
MVKLLFQQKEIDKMHLMLTDAIGKLEVQLKAQSKSLEDDRWTLKQEQMRLSKLQVVMEDDKRALIEHAGKERVELQQLITKFFEEHRQIQSQMATERKSFLEEQQKLKTDQTNWENKKEEEMNKLTRLKTELESAKEAFLIERHALDERVHQLRLDEIKLTETQHHLDFIRSDLQSRELSLNERSAELGRRNEEMSTREAALNGTQAVVTEIDAKCKRLAEEQRKMNEKLEKRQKELHEREKHIEKNEERLVQRQNELLEKEKTDKKIVCSHCKKAVKRLSRTEVDPGYKYQPIDHDRYFSAKCQNYLSRSTLDSRQEPIKIIQDISNHQKRMQMLDQLRKELKEDKDMLENERIFLNTLRHTPYI